MADSPLPEIFSNVKLLSVPERFKISGTFKDIEATFMELHRTCKEKTKGQPKAPTDKSSVYTHISDSIESVTSTPVEPVAIESVVMTYIMEKCSAELNKLKHLDVSIKCHKKEVTFHTRDSGHGTVLAQLTRQRFITFYQKIATELQTRSYSLDAHQLQPLLTKYPELLLGTEQKGTDKITLTGRFASLERFEQFLKCPTERSPPKQITVDVGAAAFREELQDKSPDKEETCCICFEQMVPSQMKTLDKCKHSFCTGCLQKAFEVKPVCPTCGLVYGALKGNQPEGGKMKVKYEKFPLPGYEKYGTITIHYNIPKGLQGDEHPNPGQPFEGAVRLAYLPNSTEGKKVLGLLQRAFEQRLIFTVGRSSTTGRSNVVTWNDIHHKTSPIGGPTAYGYPDPDYLKRVQEELKVKGIY